MLRWIILCCLYCSSAFATDFKNNKDYVSICTIFRDEARFLKEWIEYHRMIGVEKFYLYNNLSQDHYLQVLAPYIAKNIVKLIDWPYMDKDWSREVQCTAYDHCLKKYGKKSFWIAYIDVDEFIVLKNKPNLPKFLKNFEEYGGLAINWQLFGTSDIEHIPNDKTVIGTLLKKAPRLFSANSIIKSIVQTKFTEKFTFNCHFPVYKKGSIAVTERKERVKGTFSRHISTRKIWLNHYTTRDEDFFYNVKCARIADWGIDTSSMKPDPRFNQVDDFYMLRFVPELERRLEANALSAIN